MNGAVKFDSSAETTDMLIESSLFENCSSTSPGGSVYFKTGECIQEKVCYVNSLADQYGHAFYSIISKGQRCFMKYSSAYLCGHFLQNRCIYTNNGIAQLDSFNMTKEIGHGNPSYGLESVETGSFIQYLNLVNNTANISSNFNAISGAEFKILYSNYVKNDALAESIFYLLSCDPSANIENCCFKENICKFVFYAGSGLTVKSCFYDQSTTSGRSVQFISSRVDSNTISLPRLALKRCYDFSGEKIVFYSCNEKHYAGLFNLLIKSIYISFLI